MGRATYNVKELLNLKVDDVVQLDRGPDDAVNIRIENVTKFVGFPGMVKGNHAVKVTGPIRYPEGKGYE